MKKLILLFITISLLTSCINKTYFAPVQDNGLNYIFISYIGPDSCKLYKCSFIPLYGNGEEYNDADFVYLTICKDNKPISNTWQECTSVSVTNSVTYDTTIKMVPETVITKHINQQIK